MLVSGRYGLSLDSLDSQSAATPTMLPPCQARSSVRDHEHLIVPTHVVHPEHGKRMTFDVRGEAVCPTCGTRWRARRDNSFEIVVAAVATPIPFPGAAL